MSFSIPLEFKDGKMSIGLDFWGEVIWIRFKDEDAFTNPYSLPASEVMIRSDILVPFKYPTTSSMIMGRMKFDTITADIQEQIENDRTDLSILLAAYKVWKKYSRVKFTTTLQLSPISTVQTPPSTNAASEQHPTKQELHNTISDSEILSTVTIEHEIKRFNDLSTKLTDDDIDGIRLAIASTHPQRLIPSSNVIKDARAFATRFSKLPTESRYYTMFVDTEIASVWNDSVGAVSDNQSNTNVT